MMFKKIEYMLKDRRNPPYIIRSYIQNKLLTNLEREWDDAGNIKLLLTFDIEYDFYSAEHKGSNSVRPFLDHIIELLMEERAYATYFVQGDLVRNFSEILQKLEAGKNELGLHGYAHEPWGYDWFIRDQVPSLNERRISLESSLVEFKDNKLKRPISFRAPYMVIDRVSLQLLKDYGFKIDSSAQSYKGTMPIISKTNDLLEVPVSVDPIPKIRFKRHFIPYGKYFSFNMRNLLEMSNKEFLRHIKRILRIQRLHNQDNHLVFLAHSWEFHEHSSNFREYRYCNDKNFEFLREKINLITDNFDTRFFRMKDTLDISKEDSK